MATSKWPKLSFQHPEHWSQHANTLQDDFNALHTYIESNEDKHVPKYLFNILHASYSSLRVKLTQPRPVENEQIGHDKGEGRHNGVKVSVACPAAKAGVHSQAEVNDESDSDSDSDSGSDSVSGSDSDGGSDTECGAKTTGEEEQTTETAEGSTAESIEDTVSSDECSSDQAGATVVYGVVASMRLSSDTNLTFTQDYVRRIVKENKPRFTELNGSLDIKGMRWFVKSKTGRGPSYLLIEFATPQLANQAIKHGFAWKGEVHKCKRLIDDTELMPCISCLTYGHRKHQCNLKPRCCKCGGEHLSSTCSCTRSTCPTCSSEHRGDRLCQKRRVMKRDFRMAIGRQKPFWREPSIPSASRPRATSQPVQEVRHAKNQTQHKIHSDTALITPELQTHSSNPRIAFQSEPEQEARREERQIQEPILTDAVAELPDKLTQSSDLPRPSASEPEQEIRHDGSQNGQTSRIDAPASRPTAIAFAEVDLDSTPLPDDAEAIIRQLERLKAMVLARSKVDGAFEHQIAGEKRKASGPLSAVSENPRSITPKRVKQEMPAEEDPVQRYIRENNCIQYPPENRYEKSPNVLPSSKKL